MRIALLATLCLLAACQSSRHAEYTGEDAVTLVFSSDDLAAQPVICAPGTGLQETSLAVGLGGYKILEDINEAMKKSPEVRATLAPGSSVIAGFRYSQRTRFSNRKRCLVMTSFDVEAGKTYQLHLEKSPLCAITVTRQEGETWVAQDVHEGEATCD